MNPSFKPGDHVGLSPRVIGTKKHSHVQHRLRYRQGDVVEVNKDGTVFVRWKTLNYVCGYRPEMLKHTARTERLPW